MPLDRDDLKNRGQLHDGVIRREDEIDFRDLIYGMAESVAHAQAALDTELAEMTTRFAETRVDVIPRVVRTIEADGTITETADRPEARSLLELGLTPTRYQFSEATVDVEFDLSFVGDETETGTEKRTARFRVDTSEAHHRRRYHGESNTTAKISARLVPVPTPASLTPATVEQVADGPAGGGRSESEDENDEGDIDSGTADTADDISDDESAHDDSDDESTGETTVEDDA